MHRTIFHRAGEVESSEERRELRLVDDDHQIAVAVGLGPRKGAAIETFVEQADARAVVEKDLHPVAALAEKHDERAARGVPCKLIAGYGGKAIERPPKVDGRDRHEDVHIERELHRVTAGRAPSIADTIAATRWASTLLPMRTRRPPDRMTSIVSSDRPDGETGGAASASRTRASRIGSRGALREERDARAPLGELRGRPPAARRLSSDFHHRSVDARKTAPSRATNDSASRPLPSHASRRRAHSLAVALLEITLCDVVMTAPVGRQRRHVRTGVAQRIRIASSSRPPPS